MNYVFILATGQGTQQERCHVHVVNATSRADAHNAFHTMFGGSSVESDDGRVWEFVACVLDVPCARDAYVEDNADAHASPLGECTRCTIDARDGTLTILSSILSPLGDVDVLIFG